jgi:hypothetical protein
VGQKRERNGEGIGKEELKTGEEKVDRNERIKIVHFPDLLASSCCPFRYTVRADRNSDSLNHIQQTADMNYAIALCLGFWRSSGSTCVKGNE